MQKVCLRLTCVAQTLLCILKLPNMNLTPEVTHRVICLGTVNKSRLRDGNARAFSVK